MFEMKELEYANAKDTMKSVLCMPKLAEQFLKI